MSSSTQESQQQRFKELLHDIYAAGQESENMKTNELIVEIKKKLSAVLEKTH
ncbi:hypothetical protein V7201_17180 [Bacillus sp. JJ1122]|uniref:hypothetical protein n=1 Tax=Bacillus sp. JJ1122 TaxID=3122951 RepID=UPI0030006A7A